MEGARRGRQASPGSRPTSLPGGASLLRAGKRKRRPKAALSLRAVAVQSVRVRPTGDVGHSVHVSGDRTWSAAAARHDSRPSVVMWLIFRRSCFLSRTATMTMAARNGCQSYVCTGLPVRA